MIPKIPLAVPTTLLVVGVANAGETINEAGALAQVVLGGELTPQGIPLQVHRWHR
jgi:hypothetical protein